MFDFFSLVSKGFSGLTGAKSSVIGQTVPNTPGQVGKLGGDMNAYAATTSPSIELKSGLGANGQNLSSGGAAPTHYGNEVGKTGFNDESSKQWLKIAQDAYGDAQKGGGSNELQPVQPIGGAHHMNLNQGGQSAGDFKAPILGVNALLGQKQQPKVSSADIKNQFGGF